jgi:hypothetical protein
MLQQIDEVGGTAPDQLSHLVTADLVKYLALSKAKFRILEATGHFKQYCNQGTYRTTKSSNRVS